MTLTNEEYNIVEKIAKKSKCDCWFELASDDNENDIVVDTEEDEALSLEDGLLMLDDCLTELEDYDLTPSEQKCYQSLIVRMKVLKSLDKDRLMVLLGNALIMIESLSGQNIMESELEAEINITREEYDYIMNESEDENSDICSGECDNTNKPAERRKISDNT